MSDRWKRIFAFFLDWNLTLLPFFLIFMGIFDSLPQGAVHPLVGLGCVLLIILPFICIFLRDVLWGGRSLGKRIMGLWVYDSRSLELASVKQRITRNLFTFFAPFDWLILLVTGASLGDRAAGTAVLSDHSLEQRKLVRATLNSPTAAPVPRKTSTKSVIVIVVVLILVAAAFIGGIFGIVLAALDSTKDSAEYQLAYDYLISSRAFAETKADASDVFLNRYSHTSYTSDACGSYHTLKEFGFLVNGRSFTVVLHEDRGEWIICEDCTEFE